MRIQLDFYLFFLAYLINTINSAKITNTELNKNALDESESDSSENDDRNSNLKEMNRVLVKRIIPHGYKENEVEYDKQLKAYYKPIVRFHNGKIVDIPIISDEDLNSDEVRKTDEHNNFIELLYGHGTQRIRNDENKNTKLRQRDAMELLFLFELLNRKGMERNGLTGNINDKYKNDIFAFLDKLFGENSKKKKKFLERAINRVRWLEKKDLTKQFIQKLLTVLRTTEVDIKESIFNEDEVNRTEKPKVQIPYVPYWNYWTYEKTLHVDQCKHGWVRYHNMCIEMPPSP